MNTSLTKFCKDHDLPQSSAYCRCQELNISTADDLEAGDGDRLLHEFNLISVEPEPDTALSVEVQTGNPQIVPSLPANDRPLL